MKFRRLILFLGSFGDVFLGTWNGTKVALKKLKNQDAFDEFVKEAGTLR